jgi:hypothetical protein
MVQVKEVRKAKVVSLHYDFHVVDPRHDVIERGAGASLQTDAEFPAQDSCTILNDETLHVSEVNDGHVVEDVSHGIPSKLSWEPVWDADYQLYYYCNTDTWETTWEVPEGVEDYNAYVESGENLNPLPEEALIDEVRARESNSQGMKRQSRGAEASVSMSSTSVESVESVEDLGGTVTEVDQSTHVRGMVFQETLFDQDSKEACNSVLDVGSVKTTQVDVSVHVETRTKIRYAPSHFSCFSPFRGGFELCPCRYIQCRCTSPGMRGNGEFLRFGN